MKGVFAMTINPSASHELIGNDPITRYILGGKGVVTLKSHTGVHHTYSFEAPAKRDTNSDVMFIKTLVGGSEWVYVGMYKNKQFHLTKASKFQKDSAIVRGVYFILKLMHKPGYSDDRMHLYHMGVCSRCGKPLTNPESIETGIGPHCRRMV